MKWVFLDRIILALFYERRFYSNNSKPKKNPRLSLNMVFFVQY